MQSGVYWLFQSKFIMRICIVMENRLKQIPFKSKPFFFHPKRWKLNQKLSKSIKIGWNPEKQLNPLNLLVDFYHFWYFNWHFKLNMDQNPSKMDQNSSDFTQNRVNLIDIGLKSIRFWHPLLIEVPICCLTLNQTKFDVQIWLAWNPNRQQFNLWCLIA